MEKQEKNHGGVLMRDKEYVKYMQLLKKAEKEGRVDGTYDCALCGMKFNEKEEADACCRVTVT